MQDHEKETLIIEENLPVILHDIFHEQYCQGCQLKDVCAKVLTQQVVITSLLEEQKRLRDRITRIEKRNG